MNIFKSKSKWMNSVVLCLTCVVGCGLSVTEADAKPAPEIPHPKQDIAGAIEAATRAFAASDANSGAERREKLIPTVMVLKAEYTRSFVFGLDPDQRRDFKQWCWVVTFIDRVQNDHIWIYRLQDGKAPILLYKTI